MPVQSLRSIPSLSYVTEAVTDTSSELALVKACQKGDAKAFDILMRQNRKTIYAILNRLAPDWANQHDDLAQEAMIRVYRGIKALRNPHAFKSWLNQTITNLFYDELRRKPALRAVSIDSGYASDDSDEAGGLDLPDPSGQPDEMFARQEIIAAVNSAIAQLPKYYQDVIVLRELEGMAYENIAKATSVDLGTVKSRLSRARQKVQSLVAPALCA